MIEKLQASVDQTFKLLKFSFLFFFFFFFFPVLVDLIKKKKKKKKKSTISACKPYLSHIACSATIICPVLRISEGVSSNLSLVVYCLYIGMSALAFYLQQEYAFIVNFPIIPICCMRSAFVCIVEWPWRAGTGSLLAEMR